MNITPVEPASSKVLSVEVVFRPSELKPDQIAGRSVVVFDVLRATTSITAALSVGVPEIRVFGDIQSAADAAQLFGKNALLSGEVNAVRPAGFDLGNSPGDFQRELHADRVVFLSTTNGTKAIIAACDAAVMLIGALVNATAVARQLVAIGRNVTLLCSGTQGHVSMEDSIGAGAVIDAMQTVTPIACASDAARMALRLFQVSKGNLHDAISDSMSGGNLRAAKLEKDIGFCATLDSIPVVGVIHDDPLRVLPSDSQLSASI